MEINRMEYNFIHQMRKFLTKLNVIMMTQQRKLNGKSFKKWMKKKCTLKDYVNKGKK